MSALDEPAVRRANKTLRNPFHLTIRLADGIVCKHDGMGAGLDWTDRLRSFFVSFILANAHSLIDAQKNHKLLIAASMPQRISNQRLD